MPSSGARAGLAAYLLWAMFPLFFSFVSHIPALEVLGHRIIWAMLFTLIIILLLGRWEHVVTCVKSRRAIALLFSSSMLVAVNWGVFIYAVASNQVFASSLGYFITPILSVALGAIFLRERLTKWRSAAVVTACIGIGCMIYAIGSLPWVALAIALSWAFYGLIRKQVTTDTLTGLLLETALLLPFALGYSLYLAQAGQSHFTSPTNIGLLIMMGILTSLPLLLFAIAAKRLTLSVLGFLGYLAPTGHFLFALFYFKEPLDLYQLLSFSMIWLALVLFSMGSIRRKADIC